MQLTWELMRVRAVWDHTWSRLSGGDVCGRDLIWSNPYGQLVFACGGTRFLCRGLPAHALGALHVVTLFLQTQVLLPGWPTVHLRACVHVQRLVLGRCHQVRILQTVAKVRRQDSPASV